ncbi:hypothetical protein HPB48_007403 [Haemaphysalis longicornis]|uniref:Uncharacterized protein n=1 Tax=Haemaphysalis longicornis TaxID=44386 RepID=A0A9J6G733_HAELO|nr:hypothetical protein HPB48_007403 [Haemaphysalis longicornis]
MHYQCAVQLGPSPPELAESWSGEVYRDRWSDYHDYSGIAASFHPLARQPHSKYDDELPNRQPPATIPLPELCHQLKRLSWINARPYVLQLRPRRPHFPILSAAPAARSPASSSTVCYGLAEHHSRFPCSTT